MTAIDNLIEHLRKRKPLPMYKRRARSLKGWRTRKRQQVSRETLARAA